MHGCGYSTLTAEQGRIELGSVRDGQVSLDGGFALSYPGVQNLCWGAAWKAQFSVDYDEVLF